MPAHFPLACDPASVDGDSHTIPVMGLQSLLLIGTKPENDLERALLEFLKGHTAIEPFLDALINSRVFVLVKGSGSEPPAQIEPLVLEGLGGSPAVCIFTSARRASPIQKRLPLYSTGVEIDFRGFAKLIPATLGMLVNPGSVFSTEADSIGVDELRSV
jgi:hypothetical protein